VASGCEARSIPERRHRETLGVSALANFNLLSYLIDHRDGRAGDILTSTDPANRRVFAGDNGISFGPKVYTMFVQNWHTIRVPALPKESVDRLRGVTGADLERLDMLLQMQVDSGELAVF
jgi:hypothetical protein